VNSAEPSSRYDGGPGSYANASDGHDMDHYAAAACAVAEHLDLKNAVHIGHSTAAAKSPALSPSTASPRVASPETTLSSLPPLSRERDQIPFDYS
jgi:non-heme chloroperoxidase